MQITEKILCSEPIRAQSKTLRLVLSVGKVNVANIPVVVFYFVLLSLILRGLELKPGLHLLVMSVVDWKTLSLTDLAERLVLLVLELHHHSMKNVISTCNYNVCINTNTVVS